MSTTSTRASGALRGLRVLEVEGIGGSPFAAMLLADMGAEVLRIERPRRNAAAIGGTDAGPVLGRGRRAVIGLDLKRGDGLAALLDMARSADVLIEAFRPGVAERLGFGPAVIAEINPRLVYGRLTGWGRSGPLAQAAGHDINYIALSGLLGAIGRRDSAPAPPLALTGDMGGGGLMLAVGVLAALVERSSSGRGQVVDAAMVDGSALLMSVFWGFFAQGHWSKQRESNLTDGGAPFYDTYLCADGLYVSIGALEPAFFAVLRARLQLSNDLDPADVTHWPRLRAELAQRFASRNRDEWCALLEGSDACFAPVLDFDSAPRHPQLRERGSFIELDGVLQPAPSPRFDRTPSSARVSPPADDERATREALADWGFGEARIAALRSAGVLR
ncbi:CaiB/BaiF CoA transferase family protein [Hydrocarboniphaga effusa]|uniref:CaiB/BaiF CoA transferase family protein n=1 Tax=Hydrocarboniphaga effusa TaxID=243629 RepID=UPI003BA8D64A